MLIFVCSEVVESKLVKLETRYTEILPPTVLCLTAMRFQEENYGKVDFTNFHFFDSNLHFSLPTYNRSRIS